VKNLLPFPVVLLVVVVVAEVKVEMEMEMEMEMLSLMMFLSVILLASHLLLQPSSLAWMTGMMKNTSLKLHPQWWQPVTFIIYQD
jgi:hypothetical protein